MVLRFFAGDCGVSPQTSPSWRVFAPGWQSPRGCAHVQTAWAQEQPECSMTQPHEALGGAARLNNL